MVVLVGQEGILLGTMTDYKFITNTSNTYNYGIIMMGYRYASAVQCWLYMVWIKALMHLAGEWRSRFSGTFYSSSITQPS